MCWLKLSPAGCSVQDLDPVAPPLLVDYEPETDELALLQVGGEEEEEPEAGKGGPDGEEGAGAAARKRQKVRGVRCL